jgi:DNA gyrase subunit B
VAPRPEITVDAVRERAGMYIGSTSRHGLTEMVRTVLSGVVERTLVGGLSSVSVTLHADGRATLSDDGPGIAAEPANGSRPLLDRILTEPSADGGLAVVGMLCEELSIEVRDANGHHRAVVRRGELVTPLERTGDADGTTGTTIRLRPDPEIFETTRWDVGAIHEHIRMIAGLVRGVAVEFRAEASFPAVGDLGSMFEDRFTWYQPVGPLHLVHREDENQVSCEMALGWYPNLRHYEPDLAAFCNFREMREGGSAFEGVNDAFVALYGPSGAGALLSGLKGVVHVRLPDPELAGPTEARLDDPTARALIERTVTTRLAAALATHPACHAEVRSRLTALRAVTPDP